MLLVMYFCRNMFLKCLYSINSHQNMKLSKYKCSTFVKFDVVVEFDHCYDKTIISEVALMMQTGKDTVKQFSLNT